MNAMSLIGRDGWVRWTIAYVVALSFVLGATDSLVAQDLFGHGSFAAVAGWGLPGVDYPLLNMLLDCLRGRGVDTVNCFI